MQGLLLNWLSWWLTCIRYSSAGAHRVNTYMDWYVAKDKNMALSKTFPATQRKKHFIIDLRFLMFSSVKTNQPTNKKNLAVWIKVTSNSQVFVGLFYSVCQLISVGPLSWVMIHSVLSHDSLWHRGRHNVIIGCCGFLCHAWPIRCREVKRGSGSSSRSRTLP